MKSTPIQALEKATCLQPLDDRINTKVLIQASKFKRLSSHPMKRRMDVPSKSRLQRSSFVPKSNQLRKQDRDLTHHVPTIIPQYVASPPWEDGKSKIFIEVPGIGPKKSHMKTQEEISLQNILNINFQRTSGPEFTLMDHLKKRLEMAEQEYMYSTQMEQKKKYASQPVNIQLTIKQNV